MSARAVGLALALALMLIPFGVVAQPGGRAQPVLESAQQALASGDYAGAEALAARVVGEPSRSRADRAEAYRVLGLSRFFQGKRAGAKAAFVEYVRLDHQAHLDPALVPPEAIVLLEEVRAERAAELAAARPKNRRRPALNLVPPFGQFQNRQHTKGWVLAGIGLSLLATNIASYLVLRSWCNEDDGTCPGHRDAAEKLRAANLVSGAGFAATYLYGVVDGFLVMRKLNQEEAMRVGLVPTAGGAAVVLGGHF